MGDVSIGTQRPLPSVPSDKEDEHVRGPSGVSDSNDPGVEAGSVPGDIGRAAGNAARNAMRRIQEQAHGGAVRLTPEQRSQILDQLENQADPSEGGSRQLENLAPRSPTDPSNCFCPPRGNSGGFRLR